MEALAQAVEGSQRTEPYSSKGRTRAQYKALRGDASWNSEEERRTKPSILSALQHMTSMCLVRERSRVDLKPIS